MEFGIQDASRFGFQTSKLPPFALVSLSWVSGPGRKIPTNKNGVKEAGGGRGGLSLGHQRSEHVQLRPEDQPGCLQTEAGLRAGMPGASQHGQRPSGRGWPGRRPRSAVMGGVATGQGERTRDTRRWDRTSETPTRRMSQSLDQECPPCLPLRRHCSQASGNLQGSVWLDASLITTAPTLASL